MNNIQKKTYLEYEGLQCPFCQSSDLDAAKPSLEDGGITVDVRCDDCGQNWRELYTLQDVIDY